MDSFLVILDPHAVDQFIDKTPFDILTDDGYESDVNALFGCTSEVRIDLTSSTMQMGISS